ncbi:hypothetical protein BKA15_003057 [Microlunatus parietis]|uniref:Uncharacterized protein n=1 Tax=Microlunatus parietis TaxID=682979 RepID=A0A7Y9LCD6_9ACTN|nr:hypothetical protein [Microlunatus parietis]
MTVRPRGGATMIKFCPTFAVAAAVNGGAPVVGTVVVG